MAKVATYFAKALFMLWKTVDKAHVRIALHQDEKIFDLIGLFLPRVQNGYDKHEIVNLNFEINCYDKETPFMYGSTQNLPDSVDWRKKGAVNPIKKQGNCDSCWAFSAVAAVEGINKIKTGQLVSLSEQQLVDCNTANRGCKGGLMEKAFKYIEQTGGLTTDKNYPYLGKDGFCDSAKINAPIVTINGYKRVPPNDENALMRAVANQPISVAVDASDDFKSYKKGVFAGYCGTKPNHGVTLVGYGTDWDGTKYWIVRNSWGADWGEKGYIRMKRGIGAKEGLCGITLNASYPIKTSSDDKTKT